MNIEKMTADIFAASRSPEMLQYEEMMEEERQKNKLNMGEVTQGLFGGVMTGVNEQVRMRGQALIMSTRRKDLGAGLKERSPEIKAKEREMQNHARKAAEYYDPRERGYGL